MSDNRETQIRAASSFIIKYGTEEMSCLVYPAPQGHSIRSTPVQGGSMVKNNGRTQLQQEPTLDKDSPFIASFDDRRIPRSFVVNVHLVHRLTFRKVKFSFIFMPICSHEFTAYSNDYSCEDQSGPNCTRSLKHLLHRRNFNLFRAY